MFGQFFTYLDCSIYFWILKIATTLMTDLGKKTTSVAKIRLRVRELHAAGLGEGP